MSGFWYEFFLRTCWYGGSTYDAWLNIASTKLSSRVLTMPNATAEMGLPSAMVILVLQFAIGFWSSCVINILYLRHKKSASRHHDKHAIQLHEIIGGLLGRRWLIVSAMFNSVNFFTVSAVQLLTCSNLVYFMDGRLDKRTWSLIFGAIFSLSLFTPTAHNYKVWSFLGVISAVYASFYLTIAALTLEDPPQVARYTTPHSYTQYFNGISGYIYFGFDVVTVEIMDAMWKPQEFKLAYFFSMVYVLFVAMIPTLTLYVVFGDKNLDHMSALLLLPRSMFRDTAIILLLLHQITIFGFYVLGIYFITEKLFNVHDSPSYIKRTLSRVPIFLLMWLAALAFPFYGVINRFMDSTVVSWNLFIIPCAAYNVVYWPSSARRGERSFSRLGWAADFSINLGIILWVLIVESGLGLWSGFGTFAKTKNYIVFAKCYNC